MPHHVVVDGSNIATEGRSMPSLSQLNEAVMAFMEEQPDALITVVVDATFGHRIDQKEGREFDEAVANNELVAPPAGAIGRGDAFVLSIANKVGATILTNDSFQEFHGQYDWLFDEGRLIGGKPVPHIGWVFVPRIPVRGAISRGAVKDAKRKRGGASTSGRAAVGVARVGSVDANRPMPVPKAPPPGLRLAGVAAAGVAASGAAVIEAAIEAAAVTDERAERGGRRGGRGRQDRGGRKQAAQPQPQQPLAALPNATAVNDLLPFLSFVEHHPVGSSVNAIVENYSSHGAYVRVGEVKGYVPLRLMAEPAPRSAREFMKIGDAVTLVVDSFAPARRSIDLAVAGMSTARPPEAPAKKVTRTRAKKVAAVDPTTEPTLGPAAATDAAQHTEDASVAKTVRGRGKRPTAPAVTPASVDEPTAVSAAASKRTRKVPASPATAVLAEAAATAKKPAKVMAKAAKATATKAATATTAKTTTAKATAAKTTTAKATAAKATAAKATSATATKATKTSTKAATKAANKAATKAAKAVAPSTEAPVVPASAARAKKATAAGPAARTKRASTVAPPVPGEPAKPVKPVKKRRIH